MSFIVSTTGGAEHVEADWNVDGVVDEIFEVSTNPSHVFAPGAAQIAFRAVKGAARSEWSPLGFLVE